MEYIAFLNAQEINECFEKIDSSNQTLKELLLSISESENQTPQDIEQLLKTHYRLWCRNNNKVIRSFLEKRKYLLDKSFEYTPENIENLIRVNRILSDGSEKVLQQAQKLQKKLQNQNDGFTQDFEIEGTVRVSYNGNDSLIDFNPDYDEDEESDRPHIMEIIDSSTYENTPKIFFIAIIPKKTITPKKTMDFPTLCFMKDMNIGIAN